MTDTTKRPIEEITAGDDFRLSLVPRADKWGGGGHYPLWHGWALMDAFLAGIDWARAHGEQAPETKP